MDWTQQFGKIKQALLPYRYVFLVLLLGMCFMLLPEKKEAALPEEKKTETVIQEKDLETRLSELLSQLDGAGKVRVLLTQASGSETCYLSDSQLSSDGTSRSERRETVLITDNARQQSGIVCQVNPPTYLGAVVLCQGAGSAAVRLAIVEAVASAAGLSYDKITVLKMK